MKATRILNEAPATPEAPATLSDIAFKAETMDMHLRACRGILSDIIAYPNSHEHLILGLRATLDLTVEQSGELVKDIYAAKAAPVQGGANG